MVHNKIVYIGIFFSIIILYLSGCSSTQKITQQAEQPNRELALDHYLQGSVLDQKGEYAQAILEYQDALHYAKDPAIYHSIAKDYALIGKHGLAIEMGKEAVRLNPEDRTYRQTLAEIYLNALDLEKAVIEYEQIVRLDPQYRLGWLNLGRLQQMKSPTKALQTYRQIIDRFGPDVDTYVLMEQIYSATNKFDKAAEILKNLLELDPGNYDVKKRLGDVYLLQDSTDAALEIYNDLVELHPENLELRAAMAHAHLVRHDYDRAADQFDIVMKKDTLSVDEQIKFGQVFVSFIERDSAVVPYAIKMFEKIQLSYPTDWRPYWLIGSIYNIMRSDSIALYNFGKVIELAKWNPDGWVSAASIYYDRGRFDEAIKLLLEANKYVRDEFRIYFLMGISYQRTRQNVEAATALEKAIQINGKSVDAMSALGLVYDEMNRQADSDSLYERALNLDPKNHLVLNNYGYSLSTRGIQLQRALKMAKEALAQQPDNQSYLDTYGWIYYQIGDYTEAENWIRKAIELGSTSAVIHEHLGDVYFKLSDKENAIKYWKKALELDPNNQSLKDKIGKGSL